MQVLLVGRVTELHMRDVRVQQAGAHGQRTGVWRGRIDEQHGADAIRRVSGGRLRCGIVATDRLGIHQARTIGLDMKINPLTHARWRAGAGTDDDDQRQGMEQLHVGLFSCKSKKAPRGA